MRQRSPKTVVAIFWLTVMIITACGRQSVATDWPDMRVVGPFVCRADFPLNGSEPLLNELAQLQNDLTSALDIPPAREAIEMYLFHDKPTYERYLKQYYPNVPFRRAVFVKENGLGRVFAYRSEQLEIDLRHECTHALLHASLRSIPLWLDEGLAGYFELPAPERAANNSHLSSVRWNAWFGIIPHLEKLEQCTDVSKMGKAEYRDTWAWVHFMLHGPLEARQELVKYLHDLQGQNQPCSLSQRLERHIPLPEQKFATHFKTWKRGKVDN
ncbi:MAG TPA: hypothetical protein VIH42_09435 [Thermoguttaceae bacterium]